MQPVQTPTVQFGASNWKVKALGGLIIASGMAMGGSNQMNLQDEFNKARQEGVQAPVPPSEGPSTLGSFFGGLVSMTGIGLLVGHTGKKKKDENPSKPINTITMRGARSR